MTKPLEGYRVVDFTHVLAGPFATNMLVQLGADVIKVENPGRGDGMRSYQGEEGYGDTAPPFIAINSGKRSITLDLKNQDDLNVAKKLIERADVVTENFRPGVIERLGLGFEACKKLNPNIIFCSISGYGQTGPWRDKSAIDQIIQSVSGVMSMQGEPGSPSVRVGFPVIDTFSGMMAAVAILAALLQRERFGGPRQIDVSMLDSALVMMFATVVPYLVSGQRPEKVGNRGFSLSPTADTFPTKEGEITLGVIRDADFVELCKTVGRADMAQDERFKDRKSRIRNMKVLRELLIPLFQTRTALEWERVFAEAELTAGAVREVPEVTAEPFLADRGIIRNLEIPALKRTVKVLGAGFRFDAEGPSNDRPPPGLGQHGDEIRRELGLKD